MGLVLDPAFEENRRFYTCQGARDGDSADVEVIAWAVDDAWRTAIRVADPLLDGIPVNAQIGSHSGCRLRFDPTGALLVGTGDITVGTTPQDLGSLAGKVLRIDPATGGPAPATRSPAAPVPTPTCGPTGTATCRGCPCGPAPGRSTPPSTARSATTRSRCCAPGQRWLEPRR
jgi:hypothetical protein